MRRFPVNGTVSCKQADGDGREGNGTMTTVATSSAYTLTRDWMGHYTLTRVSDGKSLYFQGGDAVEVESEVEARGFDLDTWASDYDACIETWD